MNIVSKNPTHVIVKTTHDIKLVESGFFDLFTENQTKAELFEKLKDYPNPPDTMSVYERCHSVGLNLYTDTSILPTKAQLEAAIDALNTRIRNGLESEGNLESIDFIFNVAYGFNPEVEGHEHWMDNLTTNPSPNITLHPARKLYEKFQQSMIADRGFTVTAVGGTEESFPMAYTVGLGDRIGADLCLSMSMRPSSLGGVIHSLGYKLLDGMEISTDKVYLVEDWRVHGAPLRVKLKEISTENWYVKTPKLYQVLLGDGNNLLPGEEGYNTELRQTL